MLKKSILLAIIITVLSIVAGTIIGQQITPKEKQNPSLEEERLRIMQEDLSKKIEELKKLREEINTKIKEQEEIKAQVEKAKSENFQRLAKIYESMPPEEAAARLERLDDDTATVLLLAIKPRQAAKILANVNPEKAVTISKRIAIIKEKTSK
jgi:flagellar motility protein MotE (MotC chaperone)